MIPAAFDYFAPESVADAVAALGRGRRGHQGAGRRPEPDPGAEAAAGGAELVGRHRKIDELRGRLATTATRS